MSKFDRYGRIVPHSTPGTIYFVAMVIGAATLFAIAPGPIGYGSGSVTLLLLFAGYGVDRIPAFGRATPYLERIFLTTTVFLLMAPATNDPDPCPGRASHRRGADRSHCRRVPGKPAGPSRRRPHRPDHLLAQAQPHEAGPMETGRQASVGMGLSRPKRLPGIPGQFAQPGNGTFDEPANRSAGCPKGSQK